MNGGRNFFGTNATSPVNPPLSMCAWVLALASSAYVTPIIYNATVKAVTAWVAAKYGPEYTGIGTFAYGLLLSLVTFSISRMFWLFTVMTLVAATVSLSYRFLPAMAI